MSRDLAFLIDPAAKKREGFTNPCDVGPSVAAATWAMTLLGPFLIAELGVMHHGADVHREEPATALPAAPAGAATLSTMTVKRDPAGYRLAYESGMSAVESQWTVLREVRDRAGSVLSVAIAAAGFVVGLALTVDPPSRLGTIGLLGAGTAALGLSGVVLTAVVIWRPSEGRFLHDAGLIVGSYVEHDLRGNCPRSTGSWPCGLENRRASTRICCEPSSRRSPGSWRACSLRWWGSSLP